MARAPTGGCVAPVLCRHSSSEAWGSSGRAPFCSIALEEVVASLELWWGNCWRSKEITSPLCCAAAREHTHTRTHVQGREALVITTPHSSLRLEKGWRGFQQTAQ